MRRRGLRRNTWPRSFTWKSPIAYDSPPIWKRQPILTPLMKASMRSSAAAKSDSAQPLEQGRASLTWFDRRTGSASPGS
jgi:hypothetical protein